MGNCIIQNNNSDIIVSGGTKSNSIAGNSETFIATFNPLNGVLGYNYIDPSTGIEYYNSVTQGLNGKIANCGITKNPVFGYDGIIDMYFDFYVYYNFFSKGTTMFEEFYSISKTQDKGFVTVGKTTGFNAVLEEVFLMKMDSTGNYGISIVGVKENDKIDNTISIYPNPVISEFTILIKNTFNIKDLNFKIFDITGKLIQEGDIIQPKTTIETFNFSSGLYFVQLFDNLKLQHSVKISVIKS
jgi:hypothetical protein